MSDQKLYLVSSKLLIIFGILLLSAGCSFNTHLKFQGIPIDGKLESFTGELKKVGYLQAQSVGEDQMKFTGRFLEKDCNVFLFMTKKSRTPYMVRVDLPQEPYDSIKYSYERLKKHCASILGPGASKYQQFNNSSRFLFNEPKLARAPKNGDYTRYLSRKGSVFLQVRFDYLSIIYLDRRNNDLSASEGGKKINPETGREL